MKPGLLTGFRALDLTDRKGWACGLILAALGVEVLKVEPPSGDAGRADRLEWLAFNRCKKSITIDLATERQRFDELVRASDFVLESCTPGDQAARGLGYEQLHELNPSIIVTSISHFGQAGPRARWKGSDLVDVALSGVLENTGQPDRPPVKEALESTYFYGGVAAALGTVLAHFRRQETGRGQHVDLSLQEATASKCGINQLIWEFDHRLLQRSAPRNQYGASAVRGTWRCKDGYLRWSLQGGKGNAPANRALSSWMDEDRMPNPLHEIEDWDALDMTSLPLDALERYEAAIGGFFLRRTREELRTEGLGRDIHAAVIQDAPEVLANEHLRFRSFFQWLADGVEAPRHFFLASETENFLLSAAPAVGADNADRHPGPRAKALAHPRPARSFGAAAPQDDRRGALAGVKVLDFGWEIVGSMTGRALAVHGAQVVRVESMTRPEGVRTSKHIERSQPNNPDDKPWPAYLNTSKMSLQINLKHPRAARIIRRLAQWADVVNSNFTPGTMDKLGFGYNALRKLNPGIIMVEASVFGATGPLAGQWGLDPTGSAWSGRLELQGWPDLEPVTPSTAAYGDELLPVINATAIAAALDYRRRTGKGQHIESSMIEVLAQQITPAFLDWQMNGYLPVRSGNRVPNAAPHGVFPCLGEDRWCAIAATTAEEWQAFCRAAHPEWLRDARFCDLTARKAHEDELEALVSAWTSTQQAQDVMERLQAAGVPAGIAAAAQDIMDRDPQLRARGFHVPLEHPVLGTFGHPTPPYKLSETPADVRTAPLVGEHNFEVMTGILGMSVEDYVELDESGLFQ
ncbi:MAG: CoA transferase [Chloroflexi bacterium]|nr:CoA transferase [Chloroflexota bacterium]